MKYFEMFAGVGGFGLGIQRAYATLEKNKIRKDIEPRERPVPNGKPFSVLQEQSEQPTCIGLSEIDPHASNVLRYHYPNVKNYGDCTKINWSEVPDFDLLVGGSPCQDFSIAGKRAGLVGERSGLAYEYIRALEEKRPAHFIWENVRGVLSSNRGWDFAAILNQMAEAGYSLQWQVLNAKHFGVPQNRERVFVIGTREDLGSAREVFFVREDGEQYPGTHSEQQGEGKRVRGKDKPIAGTIRVGGGDTKGLVARIDAENKKYCDTDYSATLAAKGSKNSSKTGQPKDHNLLQLPVEGRIRRLMPVETERLMSWPDGHTSKGRKEDGTEYEVSDTQRYKMCGNGVVSEVVRAIVEQMPYHEGK